MKPIFWFFHGFLGEPSDGAVFHQLSDQFEVRLFPLSQWLSQQKSISFSEVVPLLLEEMEKNSPQGRLWILSGYSLGGRLAAHVFLAKPERFHGLFLLSSHLGLKDEDEKNQRVLSDQKWAQRFRGEMWQTVLSDWLAQPVFKGQTPITRREQDFHRDTLASMLSELSLGKQDNLAPSLALHKEKIRYVYGELDLKFKALAESYQSLGIETVEIKKASHRILADQAAWVLAVIQKSLKMWL
jgi:2-succinyl-6-hydroxy-2,4-cyclohexadiene-1-carboxylate synthase